MKSDHNKQLIILTMNTFSSFHFNFYNNRDLKESNQNLVLRTLVPKVGSISVSRRCCWSSANRKRESNVVMLRQTVLSKNKIIFVLYKTICFIKSRKFDWKSHPTFFNCTISWLYVISCTKIWNMKSLMK